MGKIHGFQFLQRWACVVPITVLLSAHNASAHDFWLEPNVYDAAVDEKVSVTLRVGDQLSGDTVPRVHDWFTRFAVIEPDGAEREIAGVIGDDPAGNFSGHAPGVHTLAYASTSAYTEMTPAKFARYVVDEGVAHIIANGLRGADAPAQVPVVREVFYRFAKAVVVIGEPPTTLGVAAGSQPARPKWTLPIGLKMEIVALRNHLRAHSGPVRFRVLFDGAPLAGALLVARSRHQRERTISERTQTDGTASLRLDDTGEWLIKAVHMQRAPADSGLTQWLSYWAALSFSVHR